LKDYRRYGLDDRDAALATLSSRATFAEYLLQAMRDDQVAPKDVPAFYARQILNLGDETLSERLQTIWGKLRNSPAEKIELIQTWQDRLTPEVLARADYDEGKRVFEQTCASCHSLYGEGGQLGPELNGADRSNLYYVLENIIDPGAVLPKDYWMTVLTLKNGRVLSGTVSSRSTHTLTIVGLTGEEIVPHSDIAKMEQLEQSTMPEGLLQSLSENEVRDLVAYLQCK
jgi:putative heme-binding domain-containing protein